MCSVSCKYNLNLQDLCLLLLNLQELDRATLYWTVGGVNKTSLSLREVLGSIPGPVKSDRVANGSPPLLCWPGA